MRSVRKLPIKKAPKRRFPDRENPEHLKAVRGQRCILQGRRTKVKGWRGQYPKVEVEWDAIHSCIGVVEPHHVDLKAQGGHDDLTLPICTGGHDQLHSMGPDSWAKFWSIDFTVELQLLAERLKRGAA